MSEARPISSVAKIRRGASPRPIGDPKYFGGNVGWVRISDVTRSTRFLQSTEQYLSALGESLSVRVSAGDLIMSICGTIGRPIIVDMDACIHDGFVQFYDLKDIDRTYFFYMLQFSEATFIGMGQPGTQTNLNTRIAGQHKIYCPALAQQKKIATILTSIDTAIEKTEALIDKYQQIKAGLMHDLFTRGVLPNGQLRPPREQAPELYQETAIGWIPREWVVYSLQELCSADITYGIVQAGPHVDGGIPYIRTGDMSGDELKADKLLCTTPVIAQSYKRSEVLTGEIVMAIRATVGKVLQVPAELNGANLTQGTARISPRKQILSSFLLWALRESSFQKRLLAEIKGTTFAEITLANLRELFVAVPGEEEQIQISKQISCCGDKIYAEHRQLEKLKKQKLGLMQDLLTGKVPVKIDEPATEPADA